MAETLLQFRIRFKTIARKLIKSFINTRGGGTYIPRTRSPCVCWAYEGKLNFIAIYPYAGIFTENKHYPELFRICVNCVPPSFGRISNQELTYLGIKTTPIEFAYSTSGGMSLTAIPEEIPLFGTWLNYWIDSRIIDRPLIPVPPITLVHWDVEDTKPESDTFGKDWLRRDYLWTKEAMYKFNSVLATQQQQQAEAKGIMQISL